MKIPEWKVVTRLLPTFALLTGLATPATAAMNQLAVTRNASDGSATLRWNETSAANLLFYIYRRADDGSTHCASNESLNSGWCRRLVIANVPATGKREFTDRNIVLDSSSLTEYRYRINYVTGNASTQLDSWAPNCATPTNPLENWIAQINTYSGLWLNGEDFLTVGDIPAPNGTTRYSAVTRGDQTWHFLSNDRYVALFNNSGVLIGITHRLYGMQFMQQIPGQYEPLYAFNFDTRGLRGLGLSYGLSINQPVDSNSPVFDTATQKLTFTTTGFSSQLPSAAQIKMMWTLPDEGRKGLHGRIEASNMEPNAYSDELLSVRFPILNGLGNSDGSNPGLVWPGDNGGYYFPKWPAVANADPTLTGSLHSTDLDLQFFGINLGGTQSNYWLYIGAEDSRLEPKRMFYKPYFNSTGVRHIATSYVEFYPQRGDNMDASGIAPQYDVVLTPMCAADWTPLAKHYRNWAMGNLWNNPGTLTATKNKNIPDNLKNGVFWWQSHPGWNASGTTIKNDIINTANSVKRVIGPVSATNPNGTGDNIAIHQYQWNTDGSGGNFPRYEPVESSTENLLNAFTGIQYDGTLMVPYLQVVFADISDRAMTYPANNRNGRCQKSQSSGSTTPYNNERFPADQNHGWWNSSLAYNEVKNYLIHNGAINESTGLLMNGDSDVAYYCFFESDTDSSGPLAYGDPTTEYWQNTVLGNTATLLYLNSAGLYLDSLGGGYKPDYSSWNVNYPRSHKDGHGIWWLQGYRDILQSVQWQTGALEGYTSSDARYRLLPSGQRRFISSEFFNEGLMSNNDAVLNYVKPTPFNAPVVQAVYSDYQVFAGPDLRAWTQEPTDDTRSLLLGRNFVWGYQLGLVQPLQLCGVLAGTCFTAPNNTRAPMAVYASKLTRAHVVWKNYLQFGQYMGNADPIDGNTSTFCSSADGCTTVPAIRGTLWEGPADVSTRAIVLTNTSTTAQTGNIPVPISWRKGSAQICDINNACSALTMSLANATINVTIPARDVRIVTLPK